MELELNRSIWVPNLDQHLRLHEINWAQIVFWTITDKGKKGQTDMWAIGAHYTTNLAMKSGQPLGPLGLAEFSLKDEPIKYSYPTLLCIDSVLTETLAGGCTEN